MSNPCERERSVELIVERLIILVGKSHDRIEKLQKRVYQLETYLIENSPHDKSSLTSDTQSIN